jgi:hypothetical protein
LAESLDAPRVNELAKWWRRQIKLHLEELSPALAEDQARKELREVLAEQVQESALDAEVGRVVRAATRKTAKAKPRKTRKLIWKVDPNRGIGSKKAYAALDYVVSPGIDAFSGKITYGLYRGDQPELPDRQMLADHITLDQAKALAQRDYDSVSEEEIKQ